MSVRQRPSFDLRDDSGFTLTEMMVAMIILAVFMSVFTAVTLLMSNDTAKVQRITEGVRQANQTYLTLDRSLRYAAAISTPAVSASGTWHVEYDTYTVTNGSPSDVCSQLRIASNQLQRRTWTISGTSYASGSLSSWQPITSNVVNGSAASVAPTDGSPDNRPFVAVSNPAAQFQQLTITVVAAGSATNTTTDTNRATMTFPALNSTATPPASVCQQVAVDSTS